MSQTLSVYSSDEVANVQGQIYAELDCRTTSEARAELQEGLGEMRVVLKRLKVRTKGEFACFRGPRSGSNGNSGGTSSGSVKSSKS
jgi:exocyst complex component 2